MSYKTYEVRVNDPMLCPNCGSGELKELAGTTDIPIKLV
jgi:hypothetical protein